MTLLGLKAYLSQRNRASVAEIATHFDASPAVVRDLVGHWQTRHRIRAVGGKSACGGCGCSCRNGAEDEVYEWVQS